MAVANNVKEAIGKKFQFKIKNPTMADKRIAIIPAYFNTDSVTVTKEEVTKGQGTVEVVKGVTFSKASASNINAAGVAGVVDMVLADETVGAVIMQAVGSRTIEEFLEYRKTNALALKSMSIKEATAVSGNFENDMQLCKVNPFTQQTTEVIETSKFFDRYQYSQNRVDIDFSDSELEICDDLLWIMTVPANANYVVTLRF